MLSLTVFFTSSGVFRVGQVLWCKGTKKNCDLQIFCPKVAVFWLIFRTIPNTKKFCRRYIYGICYGICLRTIYHA